MINFIKVISVIIISFALCSCNDIRRKVLYQYNGVTITRIDMDGDESLFYYGDPTKDQLTRDPDMKIFWGQRDGGFGADFIFNADKSVEVNREFGWFDIVKKNPKFYLTIKFDPSSKNYDSISAIKRYHEIQRNYNNIVYVSTLSTEEERERNDENNSKVVVKYYEP